MAVNATEIIQAAIEEIGAYDPGEPLSAADLSRSFRVLNNMLDSWSNENLACFAQLTQGTALVVGQASYTVGPGATDVPGARPLKITQAWLTDSLNNNFNIDLLDQYDWNLISNRLITSQIPTVMFYDPQDPIGIINIFPVPDGGGGPYALNWTSYLQLTEFPTFVTAINFPPGYVEALQHNLAVRLYPFFKLQPNPLVLELASETKGIVKRTNIRIELSYFDREVVSRAAGSYNIRNDSYGNRGTTVP